MSAFPTADGPQKMVRSDTSFELGVLADHGNLYWMAYLKLPTGRVELGRVSLLVLTTPTSPLSQRWLDVMQELANTMMQTHFPGMISVDADTVEAAEAVLKPKTPSEN